MWWCKNTKPPHFIESNTTEKFDCFCKMMNILNLMAALTIKHCKQPQYPIILLCRRSTTVGLPRWTSRHKNCFVPAAIDLLRLRVKVFCGMNLLFIYWMFVIHVSNSNCALGIMKIPWTLTPEPVCCLQEPKRPPSARRPLCRHDLLTSSPTTNTMEVLTHGVRDLRDSNLHLTTCLGLPGLWLASTAHYTCDWQVLWGTLIQVKWRWHLTRADFADLHHRRLKCSVHSLRVECVHEH